MRRLFTIGVVSAALVGGGLWVHAQNPHVLPSPRVAPVPGQSAENVISGADFGFRIDSWAQDGTPVGKLVIRHEGKWVEIRIPATARRVSVK